MNLTPAQQRPWLLDGGSFIDERGQLVFVNNVPLTEVQRFYLIANQSTATVRAWQAHKVESKLLFAVRGSFFIAAVKIDDFDAPSLHLSVETFVLKAEQPQLLIIPGGYANGIRALTDDHQLLVFSSLSLDESKKDSYCFPAEWWFDWSKVDE